MLSSLFVDISLRDRREGNSVAQINKIVRCQIEATWTAIKHVYDVTEGNKKHFLTEIKILFRQIKFFYF